MTPSKQNWPDRITKSLRVITDARYTPPRETKNAQACRTAFDDLREMTDQILFNVKVKRTGKGMEKMFEAASKSLTAYAKYTADRERAKVLVEAFKDAFWSWRNLQKEKGAAA